MDVIRQAKHRCDLPYVHAHPHGTFIQCECGRQWKANHPGNPEWSRWTTPLLGRRFKRLMLTNGGPS